MNTSELTGDALDWAVAKCEGVDSEWLIEDNFFHEHYKGGLRYSTDWSQGGPIIEREGITLRCGLHGWDAELPEFDVLMDGASALKAAMRCYVASKLGDTVEVPQELTK
jgi:hypothetical protein